MKKNYNIVLLGFFLFASSVLFAQDYSRSIGIVYPEKSASAAKVDKQFISWLKENLDAKSAQRYKDGSSHGTGFVIKNGSDMLLVTAGHVVSGGESVSVEFPETDTQDAVEYTNLPIVFRSNSNDLVFIALPSEASSELKPLALGGRPNNDGDVSIAGYRGYLGSPSWHTNKGKILNNKVSGEIFDIATPAVIEHSADVESGDSGGPLLAGGKVVGVNAWYVIKNEGKDDEERLSYSLSASTVSDLLKDYNAGNKRATEKALKDTVDTFMTIVSSYKYDDDGLRVAFSRTQKKALLKKDDLFEEDYVYRFGWRGFLNFLLVLENDPGTQNSLFSKFYRGGGYSVLSAALLYAESNTLYTKKGDDPEIVSMAISAEDASTATVVLNVNGKEIPTTWVFKAGYWRLSTGTAESGRKNFSFSPNLDNDLGAFTLRGNMLREMPSVTNSTFYGGGFSSYSIAGLFSSGITIVGYGSKVLKDAVPGETYFLLDVSLDFALRFPFTNEDQTFVVVPIFGSGIKGELQLKRKETVNKSFEDFEVNGGAFVPAFVELEFGFGKTFSGIPHRFGVSASYDFPVTKSVLPETRFGVFYRYVSTPIY